MHRGLRRVLRSFRRPISAAAFGFAVSLVVLGSLALPADARIFDPESFTLDNGLQVVVVTNRRAPIVTHMVWYKVGAADELPGESGNAHFLEHLMFKGTETLGPGEFSRIIARNGGRENAFTSHDFTAYYQTVARDRLEIVMRHEADRMHNLVLNDEIVLPERDVVLEERRSRVDNVPGARLSEMANAALYLNHPYRLPVIGWEHEVEALNTQTALAFYRRWYAPNNAVLVVAGDVTGQEVRALAEKYYGPIPARAVPERRRTEEPPQFAARRVTMESAQVRQPSLSITYLAPSYGSSTDGAPYALQVLEEILGGGSTSRLYRALVVESGLAISAGAGYSPTGLDSGRFVFYVSPRDGVEVERAEAALRAQISTLLAEGVSDREIATAKRRLKSASVFARDSLGAGANIFGRALTTGQSVEDVEAWPERIEAVTKAQIEAAARAVFRDEQSVTGVLLPKPTS
jgi:zinc protease